MTRWLLAVAALAVATSASAQGGPVVKLGPNPQWEDLGAVNNMQGAVDRANVRVENGEVSYISRLRYLEPREDGAVEVIFTGQIYCASNMFRAAAFDVFDAQGQVILSYVATEEDEPVAIVAGSHNDNLRVRYCP